MILEGWRDALLSGRYAGVLYDCASASVAHWINRLANKAHPTGPKFAAGVQMSAKQIAALGPLADDDEVPVSKPGPAAEAAPTRDEQTQTAGIRVPARAAPVQLKLPETRPEPQPETAAQAAERERAYREIMGITEPKPRWRWRR